MILKLIRLLTCWSGRQDWNLALPGPEGEKDESHGVSEGGSASQPVETIKEHPPPILDAVAENGSVETPFGAPVVRELPPDPGTHERLFTVRAVSASLGVSSATVSQL